MAKMKYIVHTLAGFEQPVIFCETENHADIAKALGANGKLVSAGFVTIFDGGKISCYGSSTTLFLSARKVEDKHLITRMLVDAD